MESPSAPITAGAGAPPDLHDDQIIHFRDDATIRAHLPMLYGPYGFDANRANLLMHNTTSLHPALVRVLKKRIDWESTDRAAAIFALNLDKTISPDQHVVGAPPDYDVADIQVADMEDMDDMEEPVVAAAARGKSDVPAGKSDRGQWTPPMTEQLVRLHAQRMKFRIIAAQFEGKNEKACQEHFYRSIKIQQWRDLHDELRQGPKEEEEDGEGSDMAQDGEHDKQAGKEGESGKAEDG